MKWGMFSRFLLTEYVSLTFMPYRIVCLLIVWFIYQMRWVAVLILSSILLHYKLQLNSFCLLLHLRVALCKLSITQLHFNEGCSLSIQSAVE